MFFSPKKHLISCTAKAPAVDVSMLNTLRVPKRHQNRVFNPWKVRRVTPLMFIRESSTGVYKRLHFSHRWFFFESMNVIPLHVSYFKPP